MIAASPVLQPRSHDLTLLDGRQVFRIDEYKAQAASITADVGLSRCHVHDGAALEHYCQV